MTSPKAKTKVCYGKSHAEPVELPLTEDYWYFRKSRGREGEPMSACIACQNLNKVTSPGQNGTIAVDKVYPLFKEIVQRTGKAEAARLTEISVGTYDLILKNQTQRVRKRTVHRLIVVLDDLRQKGVWYHKKTIISGVHSRKRTKKPAAMVKSPDDRLKLNQNGNRLKEYENPWFANGEPEVVLGSDLKALLKEWRERWERDRPKNHASSSFTQRRDHFYGPIAYLADQTGMHTRQIYNIVHNKQRYVSLSKAEKILMAIDQEYLLANGTIRIIPNPRWSQERWQEYMRERGCA